MVPDFEKLMRPVLKCAEKGEAAIYDVVQKIADDLQLTEEEKMWAEKLAQKGIV